MNNQKRRRSSLHSLKKLLQVLQISLAPYKLKFVFTAILSIIMSTAQIASVATFIPILSILSGKGLEKIQGISVVGQIFSYLPKDLQLVVSIMLATLLGMIIVQSIIKAQILVIHDDLKSHVDSDWRVKTTVHWLDQPSVNQGQENKSNVMHLNSSDIPILGTGISSSIMMLSAMTQGTLVLVFLAALSWKVFLTVLVMLFVIMIPLTFVSRHLLKTAIHHVESFSRYGAYNFDLIKKAELIKIFQTDDQEISGYQSYFKNFFISRHAYKRSTTWGPLIAEMGFPMAIVIVIGIQMLMLKSELFFEEIVFFVIVLTRLQPIIGQILNSFNVLAQVEAAAQRVERFLEREVQPISEGTLSTLPKTYDLQLKNTSFEYPNTPHRKILENVSINIAAGKLTMIFGASGAGKSTFLKLLQGMYLPSKGQIVLGGINISEYDQELLSQLMKLMPQDAYIFHGSLLENITYGSTNKNDCLNLEEAIQLACVDEFLQYLPERLNSPVGDDGSFLSVGQRQRVALARVLYNNPSIFILDEPTSALDQHLEANLIDHFFKLCDNGKTIVMSTHKVELAHLADHLLWFEDGQIHEGRYADFEKQLNRSALSNKNNSTASQDSKSEKPYYKLRGSTAKNIDI